MNHKHLVTGLFEGVVLDTWENQVLVNFDFYGDPIEITYTTDQFPADTKLKIGDTVLVTIGLIHVEEKPQSYDKKSENISE